MWYVWIGAALVLVAIALAWWVVFRGAMRSPNNGNEFSVDWMIGPFNWGSGLPLHEWRLTRAGNFALAIAAIALAAAIILIPWVAEAVTLVVGAAFCIGFPAFLFIGSAVETRRRSLIRERRRLGLCERCGYDLRASERRCPECGRKIAWRRTRTSG